MAKLTLLERLRDDLKHMRDNESGIVSCGSMIMRLEPAIARERDLVAALRTARNYVQAIHDYVHESEGPFPEPFPSTATVKSAIDAALASMEDE